MTDVANRSAVGRTLPVLVVVFALFAGACGGDGSSSTSDLFGDDAEVDEDLPGDDDSSAFCGLLQEQFDRNDEFNPLRDSDVTEAYVTLTLDRIDAALRIAPAETRPHIETIRSAFEQLREVLPDLEWDFIAAADEADQFFGSADFAAADAALDEYAERVCGIDPGDDTADGGDAADPFDSPEALAAILETDLGRQAFAEGMAEDGTVTFDQALCLAETLDVDLLVALSFDAEQPSADVLGTFLQTLGDCGVDPGDLIGGG